MDTKELQVRIAELEAELAEAQASAEQNQFLADATMNATYAFSSGYPDGTLYVFNKAFCELTGYTGEELRSIKWAVDLTPEEWREAEKEKLAEMHRTGEAQLYEKEYIRKDGSRVPIEIKTHLILDDEGNPEMYYVFAADITERKRAMDTLQTLYQISHDLNAADDEAALLQVLARPAAEAGAIEADLMYIEPDQAGSPARCNKVATWQREGASPTPAGTHYHIADFPLASLMLSSPGEAMLIADIAADERLNEETRTALAQPGVGAVVLIPLTQAGHRLGFVSLMWDSPQTFSEQEREIYSALTGLAAPAVQSRRLVTNLEHMVEERTAELQRETSERERLQEEIIDAQKRALQELSTPIIPVMDRIIVMPLIGSIDTMRARDITRSLLAGIGEHRAKVVILDITGVPIVDSGVADHLNKTIQAARLKGARTIVTGISDAVAETIIDLGIDWSNVDTMADLRTGLVAALESLGIRLTR